MNTWIQAQVDIQEKRGSKDSEEDFIFRKMATLGIGAPLKK